ncbi:hypothetical protein ACTODO_01505 [Schaalia dentiphila ATCC 17982]|uniref:Uncharacterized protein n=1 Tax=Schaalia dentiphila ATCC 17982 TaxID=411466 RepID=A7BCW9_9ACTO|nr:hypothetical protein ACTODO_01505 [Schaalia odontolytica ATCC 17982]
MARDGWEGISGSQRTNNKGGSTKGRHHAPVQIDGSHILFLSE